MGTDNNKETQPVVETLAGMVDYQKDSVVSRTLIKKEKGTVTLFAFEKGAALSEHTTPFDALVYVVEGKAEISIAKKDYFLEAGQTIVLPANRPHAVKAATKTKMLLTMIRA